MQAVPEGKSPEDKYYLGFFKAGRLIAVMDLISGYPDQETAFIGFFMMNMDMQGQGAGSHIIEEVCACLNKYFSYIRLGYVKSNEQSRHFWQKNGFMPTGNIADCGCKVSKRPEYPVRAAGRCDTFWKVPVFSEG